MKGIQRIAFGLCFLMLNCFIIQGQELLVGMVEKNITPPVGYPHYRGISTGVHDSLYAKTMYLQQGDEEVAVVSCDLLWVGRTLSTAARMSIATQTSIPYENIIIAGTHSHTSPAYENDILELNEHIRGPIPKVENIDGLPYDKWLANSIANSVLEAKAKREPMTMEFSSGYRDNLSFNRRYFLNTGKVKTNPGILNPAAIKATGPNDPEVGILWMKDTKGQPKATFVNFANHTDTKGGTEFSADFPGFLAQKLKSTFGEDFVSIYGQGTCGNLNHVNIKKKEQLTSEEIGFALADEVERQLPVLRAIDRPDLSMKSEIVYAPLQHYTEDELAQAKTDQPFYEEEAAFFQLRRSMKIRSLERIRKFEAVPPTVQSGTWMVPVEIQVIKLNDDVAIVGMPGEVFVELGLAIKEASPFKMTMVLELTNAHIAYVPTEEGFKQGGYETINSRLAPGGGELMAEAAIRLLKDLKD
ncbi:hypothetical protein [Membranihabitans marinus]|uniref:hypothetical protein n=1 Tax=Membranihabitans marinus TaxID=1227546 RepID=UPI001F388687|nr:hypothetical protein [Membranihabitans marinus]